MELITSRRNGRVVEARKLAQRKHRQRQGRFLVEGLPLLEMATAAGARPLQVFFCPQLADETAEWLLARFGEQDAELLALSPDVMQTLAERETPEGILAVFPLQERNVGDLTWAAGDLVLILDRLQDPGNLGTLIRTADAAGAAAVILIEPCVDPFDPKTVRGTMGSLFNVPVARTSDIAALFEQLRAGGLRIVGADAYRGQDWGVGLWQGGVALALGDEVRGLSADVAEQIQAWAKLPIAGRAESLNVAVAGGILMYQWLRER